MSPISCSILTLLCVPSLVESFDSGFSPPLAHPPPRPFDPMQVSTCPYSTYGAWVGGSILCSLSTFKDMWVTSMEYRDCGPSIIHRRSF